MLGMWTNVVGYCVRSSGMRIRKKSFVDCDLAGWSEDADFGAE